MIFLLERLWPALALAAVLGLLFAALGGRGRSAPSARNPFRTGILVLLASACLAVWSQVVPGTAGLWLDIGVSLAVAYLVGALAGTGLRRVIRRRDDDLAPDQPVTTAPARPSEANGAGRDRPAAVASPTASAATPV